VVLFAIFYFLIIRPQQKQAKQHKTMLEELKKGDKIVTNGGLIAEITKVEEEYFKAILSDKGDEVKIVREAVAKKYEPTLDTAK
jgi:preprotein translocase subunit YajC